MHSWPLLFALTLADLCQTDSSLLRTIYADLFLA